jgi:hypothetical protein
LAPRWDTAAARRGGGRDDEAEVGVGCDEREREGAMWGGGRGLLRLPLCVHRPLAGGTCVCASWLFFYFLFSSLPDMT